MKPYISVLVFLTIVFSSIWASIYSYKTTESHIIKDLNRALYLTLEEKQDAFITPDTIATYRNHLTIPQLKDCAYVSYSLRDDEDGIMCSIAMKPQTNGHSIGFRGYANCSFGTIFGISDQRLSLFLSIGAILWGLLSIRYFHRRHPLLIQDAIGYGDLYYSEATDCFYNETNSQLHLTPLQHKLMKMFFNSTTHQLSKSDICNSLWPKKDDASETLYALIKRLRPTIESNSKLKIETDRGRSYKLIENK